MKCERHQHSSVESAERCWVDDFRKKKDRQLAVIAARPALYIQEFCYPPQPNNDGPVTVWYFARAAKVGWK